MRVMFKHLKEENVEVFTSESWIDINAKNAVAIKVDGMKTIMTLVEAHRLKRLLTAFLSID